MRNRELESLLLDESESFENRMLRVFSYQFEHIVQYKTFCEILGKTPKTIQNVDEIPFYPIQAFKQNAILSSTFYPKNVPFFQSSGTSKQIRSLHFVPVLEWYEKTSWQNFCSHFNTLPLFAYVPSYSENPHSSLVYMLNHFVKKHNELGVSSTFLPISDEGLHQIPRDFPVILFGAAFGLLNATEKKSCFLHPDSIIVETGGMKTFRKELTKKEMAQLLKSRFNVKSEQICSEYGMAELVSQAYKMGAFSAFKPAPLMRVSIRNPENPMEEVPIGAEGQLAIVDLGNLYSCSFILTEDRGVAYSDGNFDVLGRLQDAELRGCNFLFERDL